MTLLTNQRLNVRAIRSVALCLILAGLHTAAHAADVIIVDDDNANNTAGAFSVLPGDAWSVAGMPDFTGQWMADYHWKATDDPAGVVEWRPTISAAGEYEVAVWYRSTGSGRPNDAVYTVDYDGGSTPVTMNQQTNGSRWVTLGTFPFAVGASGRVTLSSAAQAGKNIIADAVRFRPAELVEKSQAAGMRVSRIPFSPFPQPEFFIETANCLTTKVPDAAPTVIWIVSLYWSGGDIGLNFPNPTGQSYPHMNFSSTDKNEAHLTAFDAAGINVWLQVESGDANVEDLIDIVLGKYGHHPCVVGFGVDGEWFVPTEVSNGRAFTDLEAQAWLTKVKTYNPTYRLFLKHYIQSKMPPTLRSDILFVDDSQGYNALSHMVSEFSSWGSALSPGEVGFQYGYPNDRPWWSQYADPAGTLASALDAAVPNATTFFWVDFTIEEIVPVGIAPTITVEPLDVSVSLGQMTGFSVVADGEGEGELTYQWQREGVDLVESETYIDVTTSNLLVSVADTSVAGEYRCIVSNSCGSATSTAATLSLLAPGDFDGNGKVDHADWPPMQFCLQGPDATYAPGHYCMSGDVDEDTDVDVRDFGGFQAIFTD